MRASGPYEVKPQQLRTLVLLLALLPLLAHDVRGELSGQERGKRGTGSPGKGASRLPAVPRSDQQITGCQRCPAAGHRPRADRSLAHCPGRPGHGGRRAHRVGGWSARAPPRRAATRGRAIQIAEALAKAALAGGAHHAALPPNGPVRWRFLTETPEAIFSLHPQGVMERRAAGESSLLLLKTRQHLVEQIAAFYQHELDPQTALRLVDESGESVPLVGPAVLGSDGSEPLAQTSLPPPLPPWQVKLFTADAVLVSGVAHEQIMFYWWSVGGMIAATAAIAGTAGWALTRRIALHELSNDALAVVSHEMKTPLASTRLLIETLLARRYQGGSEAIDEYLRLIAGENVRLERMVESFQTLSRLEQPRPGRERLQMEAIQAGEIIETARTRLAGRLEGEGCRFSVEGDADSPPFSGDREALTAVIVNLLDNALKYSKDEKRIVLKVKDRVDRVLFEVCDDGIGIVQTSKKRFLSASIRRTTGSRARTKAAA